jgi:serine/threonine protein phosphatase PrpC
VSCSACDAPLGDGDRFCESCGAATAVADDTAASVNDAPPADDALATSSRAVTNEPRADGASVEPSSDPCRSCGGVVGNDSYCSQCGTRALSQRDHWSKSIDVNLAAVCDKGISHARNEDAMDIGRSVSGAAVLVVCDGVTSAPDSDRASLAAAIAACASLCAITVDTTSLAAKVSVWSAALTESAVVAQREVVAVTHALGDPVEPPSSTFVAAVMDGDVICAAWLGDSRAYWLGDDVAIALSTDDSMAAVHIAEGMTVSEAESQSDAHTITRWLGVDAPTVTARTVSHRATASGWLCVVSDGLWNYASSPSAVDTLVRGDGHDVDLVARAERVVAWANAQGGHDNITVALHRFELDSATSPSAPADTAPADTAAQPAGTGEPSAPFEPVAAPAPSVPLEPTGPTTQER